MVRRIVLTGMRLRVAVLLLAAAVLTLGLAQVRQAPVDVLPEFKAPYVEVQTEALGLSAEEVEQLITSPMEADLLNGVAFLDEIRSDSVAGLSSIQMYFEPGTDVLRARQMVQERLTEARALPNVSRAPVMLQPLSSTGRALMVGLSTEDMSLIDLSVLARWKIKPRLLGVPGVANVAVFGQRERQLQVQVDPQRLEQRGVTLSQVVENTANSLWVSPLSFVEASTPGTGGFIDTPQQRLGIQHVLPITTADDLARISLGASSSGSAKTLGDVATVTEDHQPLIGDALGDGGPQLTMVIEKFPAASTLEVTRGVEEALQALAPGLEGVRVDATVYRPAGYVADALDNISLLALVGLLLAAIVMLALLHSWRAAVVGMVSMTVALAVAVVVLRLTGTGFNMLVLAGLVVALGVVVDDAVVHADSTSQRLRKRRRDDDAESSPSRAVLAAYDTLRSPLVVASLVLLVAVAPLLALGGIPGDLFRPLVLSYGLAVLASMAVVLVVTPALSSLLLAGVPAHRPEPPVARWLRERHRAAVARVSGRTSWVHLTVVLLLLAGLAVLPQLDDGPTLPARQDRDLLLRWDAPPGTSLPTMSATTSAATNDLRALPGVRNVGAHVGRAVTSDKVVGVNSGEIWVSLSPEADFDASLADVQAVLDRHPLLRGELVSYPEQRMDDLGPRTDAPVVVRIYGEDAAVLETQAEALRQQVAGTEGLVDPQVQTVPEEPTVQVEVDLARAQEFGLKPGDVRRAAATMVAGIQVGSIFEEQKIFEVVVVGVPAARDSLDDVRGMLIDAPGGTQVRLDKVADVRIAPAPVLVQHDAVARYVDVTAGVAGRDIGDVVSDVEREVRSLGLPVGYHAAVLGEAAERRATTTRVQLLFLAAALVVFLLLQSLLDSWRLATLLCLVLPAALVGGVAAALVAGDGPARSTLLGLVVVLGIALRQAVVLMTQLQQTPHDDEGRPVPALVTRVAGERVVPVLATALATAGALLPFVLAGNVPGSEVVRPLAITVLGGLGTTVLLVLFVLPALYLRHGEGAGPEGPPPPVLSQGEGVLPDQRSESGRERSGARA